MNAAKLYRKSFRLVAQSLCIHTTTIGASSLKTQLLSTRTVAHNAEQFDNFYHELNHLPLGRIKEGIVVKFPQTTFVAKTTKEPKPSTSTEKSRFFSYRPHQPINCPNDLLNLMIIKPRPIKTITLNNFINARYQSHI